MTKSYNAAALAAIAAASGRMVTLEFETDSGKRLRVNGRFLTIGKNGKAAARRAYRAGIARDAVPFHAMMLNGERVHGRDSSGRFLPSDGRMVWVSFRTGRVCYVAQDGQRITLA